MILNFYEKNNPIFFILFTLFLGSCDRSPRLPKNDPALAKKIAECARLSATKDPAVFYAQYRRLAAHQNWFIIVDKTHSLPKDYKPKDLLYRPPFPALREEVLSQLIKMYHDAQKENVLIETFSRYRSFFHQQILNKKSPTILSWPNPAPLNTI